MRTPVVKYSTGGSCGASRRAFAAIVGLTPAAATGQSLGSLPSTSMSQPGARAIFPQKPGAIAGPALERGHATTRPLDEIMHRYASGDDGALDDLYRLGAPRIRSFLARLCADLALADDLTQDAFLRIYRARGTFTEGASALPWMLAIARNAFLDHVRRERVRRAHQASSAEGQDDRQRVMPDNSSDRTVIARQMLGVAQQALMKLPGRQREAFVLLRFEGLSPDEAAQVLGATHAAVKILVHRACVVIRAALEREDKGRAGPR